MRKDKREVQISTNLVKTKAKVLDYFSKLGYKKFVREGTIFSRIKGCHKTIHKTLKMLYQAGYLACIKKEPKHNKGKIKEKRGRKRIYYRLNRIEMKEIKREIKYLDTLVDDLEKALFRRDIFSLLYFIESFTRINLGEFKEQSHQYDLIVLFSLTSPGRPFKFSFRSLVGIL